MSKKSKGSNEESMDMAQGVELAPTNLTAPQKAALCEAVNARYGDSLRQLRTRINSLTQRVTVDPPTGPRCTVRFFPTQIELLQAMESVPNFQFQVPHPSGEAGKFVSISWETLPPSVKKAVTAWQANARSVSTAFRQKSDKMKQTEENDLRKLDAQIAAHHLREEAASLKHEDELTEAVKKIRAAYAKKWETISAKLKPKEVKLLSQRQALRTEHSKKQAMLTTDKAQKLKALEDARDAVIVAAANEHSAAYTRQIKLLEEQYAALEAALAETILRIKLNGAAETGIAFLNGLPSPDQVMETVTRQLKALPSK